MPALWDEPFGLTLIEALVSGTPVLGTRRGALLEIVAEGVGALGDSLEELVELRPSIERIDPEACRAHVLKHFDHLTMARAYERVYRTFLEWGSLTPPTGRPASADS
jgi:glycosyltransferase involved in cell wall biosynthesis